jgi:Zn-finger nucleic acid-binding protein
MKCPVCNINLVMADRSGIEIDYCPDCRGVWLDRGELDKIIERSAPQQPASTQPPSPSYHDQQSRGYGRDSQDDYYYKKRKRKSFFDDLFDF